MHNTFGWHQGLRVCRRGITLIEMLFSIAILLIGMVGIASVLGVAGRNAVRGRTLTESQIVANNALNSFISHRMNSKSLWNPMPIEARWSAMPYTGVCIDPLWIGSDIWFGPRNPVNVRNFGMRRVGVENPDPTVPAYTSKVYEKIFLSDDDLVRENGERGDLFPASRLFERFAGGTLGQSSKQGTYSWFVTIPWIADESPHSQENNSSNGLLVSFVVCKNRDRRDLPIALNVRPVPPNTTFNSEVGGSLRVLLENVPSSLTFRSGDWVMLSTRETSVPFDSWYRVLSVSSDSSSSGVYKATLAGRDLPVGTTIMIGTFVPGVVFVSERLVPILP